MAIRVASFHLDILICPLRLSMIFKNLSQALTKMSFNAPRPLSCAQRLRMGLSPGPFLLQLAHLDK